VNAELRALCEQDQEDRRQIHDDGGQMPEGMLERDRVRRQRVDALLASGAAEDGKDYFHAALIFQHGETLDDYWRAYELARKAAELGDRSGRSLAAAAYDRWLMRQLKPQKYGTQFVPIDGQWRLWDLDPTTTDEERAAWDVPPPEEALCRIHKVAGTPPKLNLDGMPDWIRDWMGEVLRRMGAKPDPNETTPIP